MSRYTWYASAAEAVRAIENGNPSVDFYPGSILGEDDVKALADAVRRSHSLQELWLSGNRITDVGALALANAVALCPSLQTLWLHNNLITDVGASVLADAVCRSKSLAVLDLSGNQITDVGASALARAVVRSPSLQELLLWVNPITDDGYGALQDAFDARHIARATAWLACAPSGPITLFFNKDGDRAVWSEVASFLVLL